MQKVVCQTCEKLVDPVDCWCLITVGIKERKYECKKFCIVKPKVVEPPKVVEVPKVVEAPKVVEPPKAVEVRNPLEIEDPELTSESALKWSPSYPSESIVRKIINWFTVPSGYTKVKTH